jgi:hypothetical protein
MIVENIANCFAENWSKLPKVVFFTKHMYVSMWTPGGRLPLVSVLNKMKKREYKNNRPILEHQFLEIWPGLPDEILSNKKNPIWVDF